MVRHTEAEIKAAYCGESTARDYVAERFESQLMRLLHEMQVREVNRVMTMQTPKRTLEIAPGPGRLTREVTPVGDLVCLEYNEGMIEEGKRACGDHVQWLQGDAFDLPFQDSFDLVYSFRFIRHFRRADRERLYQQVRKALKPDGRLIVDAVNGRVSESLRQANPEAYPVYDKLYRHEGELEQEMQEAGFVIERLTPVQRWFGLQYQLQVLVGPRSDRLARMLIRLAERLSKGPALEWVVTCRRA